MTIDPDKIVDAPALALYNHSARHFAWKKRAIEAQKTNWRVRLQLILDEPDTSRTARVFSVVIMIMIFAQVVVIMLQSGAFDVDCENPVVKDRLTVVDAGLSIGFTMELAMRTVTATSAKQMCHSVFWWIDVVAVAPFYLDLVATAAAGDPYLAGGEPQSEDEAQPEPQDRTIEDVQDLLSLLRVVRVLKVIRHHPDSKLLYDALRMSARPLLVPLTFLIVVSFFFGAAVYYFEKLETGATGKFPDIGTSIWFMLVTFSTVGYGDYAPVTHSGRAITSLAIIAGVIFMSMPLNIVGSNFSKVWAEKLTSAVVLKIQEHMIDQMLTVRDVRKLFESVDLDSTGVLNLHEFTHFISKLQVEPPLSPSSMRVLFAAFDENHSDYISFFEFCHVVFPDLDIEEMVLHDAPQKVDGSKSAFMQMADGVSTLLSPRRTASSDLAEHKFKVGDRVKHKSRGIGTVIELMEDTRTRIQFDDGEEHRYWPTSMHKVELIKGSGKWRHGPSARPKPKWPVEGRGSKPEKPPGEVRDTTAVQAGEGGESFSSERSKRALFPKGADDGMVIDAKAAEARSGSVRAMAVEVVGDEQASSSTDPIGAAADGRSVELILDQPPNKTQSPPLEQGKRFTLKAAGSVVLSTQRLRRMDPESRMVEQHSRAARMKAARTMRAAQQGAGGEAAWAQGAGDAAWAAATVGAACSAHELRGEMRVLKKWIADELRERETRMLSQLDSRFGQMEKAIAVLQKEYEREFAVISEINSAREH